MELLGIGYPAIICRDMAQSVEFYEKLGMTRLYAEPNRDDAESVQALLHAGGGSFLLLVGPTHEGVNIAEASPGVGAMQYLALRVSAAFMDEAYARLARAGLQASEEIRRGYERLVFLEDPNGVLVALVAWAAEPPAGAPPAAALARAVALRDAEGSPFVEAAHLRRAVAEEG